MRELKKWLAGRRDLKVLPEYIGIMTRAGATTDDKLFYQNRINGFLAGLWDSGQITNAQWNKFGQEVDREATNA